MGYAVGIVVVAAVTAAVWVRALLHHETVYEYERGLKYVRGRFAGVLGPGRYWYWKNTSAIWRIDIRPRIVTVPGQEVLSSDGVTLKVSVTANYEIIDAAKAFNKVQDYQTAMYTQLQLGLREIIGEKGIEDILKVRQELSNTLLGLTQGKANELGLNLISVGVKDIMFPGKLKEMFAQVVNAKQEGLAALERARGETAALRNMANAAKMVESNPALMQLRLLQAVGGTSGNTLVLGMPSQGTMVPLKTGNSSQPNTVEDQPQEG